MKYKVGDKVRIVSAWPEDGSAHQNPEGRMDKWLGKIMTIREICPGYYRMEEDQGDFTSTGWSWWPGAIAGLAYEFKVGDRVIIEKSNIESLNSYAGLVGTVEAICGRDYAYRVSTEKCPGGVWCEVRCLANEKIIVMTDGKTTTAKLFCGKELVKSAEAKCSPSDAFDFEKGAALAVDRLLGREEKKPANPFKVGDYVRIIACTRYSHGFPVGSMGRVSSIAGTDSCIVDGFFSNGDRADQFVCPGDLEKI